MGSLLIMSAQEQAPTQPSGYDDSTGHDVRVVNVGQLQDEVELTRNRYQVHRKLKEFVGLVDTAAAKAVDQKNGVIEVVANADPALLLAATGRIAVSGIPEIRVLDEHNGNTLSFGLAGRIEHGGEDAGEMIVSLGKSLPHEGGVKVTPLIFSTKGQIAPEALVPISDQGADFIPEIDRMPRITFEGDPDREFEDGEVISIGKNTPRVVALAAVIRLFRLREMAAARNRPAIEADSGREGLSRVIAPSTGFSAGKLALGELAYGGVLYGF